MLVVCAALIAVVALDVGAGGTLWFAQGRGPATTSAVGLLVIIIIVGVALVYAAVVNWNRDD